MPQAEKFSPDEILTLREIARPELERRRNEESGRIIQDEAERRAVEREAKRVAAGQKAKAAYFKAVADLERKFLDFLEAEAAIYQVAKDWRNTRDSDPVGNLKLTPVSLAKRISKYVAVGLATSPGVSVGKYGEISLLKVHGRFGIWLAGEQREFGMKENGK